MAMINATCAPVEAGVPNTWRKPALACCAPKPKEVARPNKVAKTAKVSIMLSWPITRPGASAPGASTPNSACAMPSPLHQWLESSHVSAVEHSALAITPTGLSQFKGDWLSAFGEPFSAKLAKSPGRQSHVQQHTTNHPNQADPLHCVSELGFAPLCGHKRTCGRQWHWQNAHHESGLRSLRGEPPPSTANRQAGGCVPALEIENRASSEAPAGPRSSHRPSLAGRQQHPGKDFDCCQACGKGTNHTAALARQSINGSLHTR